MSGYLPGFTPGLAGVFDGPDETPVIGKVLKVKTTSPLKLELADDSVVTIPGSNDQVLTSDGAGGLIAESGLTFNGSRLEIPTGNVRVGGVGVTEITPLQISYLHGNGAGTYIGANGISVGPVAAYWFANGNAAATRDTRFQRVSANVVALKDAGTTLGTLQAATVTTGSSSIPLVLRDTVDIHSDGNGTLYRQTANQAHTFANAAGTAIGSFAMLSSVPLLVMGAQGSAPGIKYVAANTLSVVGNDRTTLGTLQAATVDNPSAALNLGTTASSIDLKVQTTVGTDEGLLSWSGGNFVVRGASGKGLALGADNATSLTLDTSGNATFSGNVGIGAAITATGKLDVDDDVVRVRTAKTPATAGAAGNQGDIAWDADYIYVCTATNTWKRTAIATW